MVELAKNDPSLRERQPYKAFLERDMKTIVSFGKQDVFEVACATHAVLTEEAFDAIAREWLSSAKHPTLKLLHHDDAEREFAYDRDFRLSPLAEALDRAGDYGITIASMKRDWNTVFGN